MPRHRSLIAFGLLACLTITACSTQGHSTGALSTTGPTAGTAAPSASGSPIATDTPPGGTTPTTSTTGSGGTTSPESPIKITTTVQPVSDVETTACPHTSTITATVAVSRGPITVTYAWKDSTVLESVRHTLAFTGSGPQKKTISIDQTLSGQSVHGGETLEIIGHSFTSNGPASVTYGLVCDPSAETPIADPSSSTTCPYTAQFKTNIHTFGPGDVTYEWHFSDGTVVSNDVNFTGAGAAQETVFTFHAVPFTTLLNRFGAYLAITSGQGFTTGTVHPACRPRKAP